MYCCQGDDKVKTVSDIDNTGFKSMPANLLDLDYNDEMCGSAQFDNIKSKDVVCGNKT